MTEVENMRMIPKAVQNRVDLPVERRATRHQGQRIQVSLQGGPACCFARRPDRVRSCFEPIGVSAQAFDKMGQMGSRASHESDDRRIPGRCQLYPRNYFPQRGKDPALKFMSRQNTGPTVENLNNLNARVDLAGKNRRPRLL